MSVKTIDLHKDYKVGDNIIHAVNGIDLEVKDGTFAAIMGRSGCGKTTLLHLIGGLDRASSGKVIVNDNDLSQMKDTALSRFRCCEIGFVFQKFNLINEMTVKENIITPVLISGRKVNEEYIAELTEVLGLSERLDHTPLQLSGGQQQRVAIARTLAPKPKVLFMDEPLSNLDAKLRVEMREVIKEIQNSLGITTVYVTHDQEEAMAVSDRIAVMNSGVIQQIGKPKDLYQRPSNLFVATFIGRTNVLDKRLTEIDGRLAVDFDGYLVPMDNLTNEAHSGQSVKASVRPEEFVIVDKQQPGIEGVVEFSTFLGLNTHYLVRLKSGERVEIIQESKIEDILEKGSTVHLSVKGEKINIFTETGETSLIKSHRGD